MFNIKYIALIALVSLNLVCSEEGKAQDLSGPMVPCVGVPCEGQEVQPWPETGAWYNPEQSGSGFTIEIQNGRMLAFYYGYDEEGEPTWWQYAGELQSSEEPLVWWVTEGSPNRYSGGNCFGCDYVAPAEPEALETVRFEFLQRAHLRLTLPDGSQQYMIPITYGSSSRAFFPEYTDHLFPLLEPEDTAITNGGSEWYFVLDQSETGEEDGPWHDVHWTMVIHEARFHPDGLSMRDPGPVLSYPITYYESFLTAIGFGRIWCELKDVEGEIKPGCTLEANGVDVYEIPIGNFTDSRIQGVTDTGKRFEAYRVWSD